jgi:predicted amidohydrolase YtcJ
MASRLTTYLVVLIVTGTVIAGLIVGAQRDEEAGRVDLIVTNGKVFTGADEDFAEALAIQGNKILQVGSNREIKRLRRPQTLMVDAHGGAILPGFIDAHVHLAEAARARAGVDLADAATAAEIEDRIREFARAHPDAEWIRGRGWSYALFPDGLPTRHTLDQIVPERPAFLVAEDGRTAWVNTRALTAAGITRRTPDPRDGMIVRDARTGDATGALRETAQALVAQALPDPSATEQLEGLQAAIQEAHSVGVTSVHSVGDREDDIELYDTLRTAGALQLRVYSALAMSSWSETELARLDALQQRYPDDPLLKTGAVVVSAAAVAAPALVGAVHQTARTATDLATLVAYFDARGWQTLVEVTSAEEAALAVDAFEAAREMNPPAAAPDPRRHRLDHAAPLDAELVTRLADVGVAVGVGAGGDEQIAAWRLILDAGGRVAFGSDWPSMLAGPGERLAGTPVADTTEDTAADLDQGERGLGLADTIEGWTSAAAWTSSDDQRKGRLVRGMLADIIILNTDIFRPDQDLSRAVVETTIFDGKVVYARTPVGTH